MTKRIGIQRYVVFARRLATSRMFYRVTDSPAVDIEMPIDAPGLVGDSYKLNFHTFYFLPFFYKFCIIDSIVFEAGRKLMADELRETLP